MTFSWVCGGWFVEVTGGGRPKHIPQVRCGEPGRHAFDLEV
jgi:hypothetical protein